MKKLLFIAAVAAIALTSCQQEKDFHGGSASDKGVSFAIQGAETRSASTVSPVSMGETILVGKMDGLELYMEESIIDLNAIGAETRGAPVYTENVGYLYRDQLGVFAESGSGSGVEATYSHLDENKNDQGVTTGWVYQHQYSENIWPDEDTDVQFYLRMPTDMTSHGVTSLSNEGGVTTVEYTSKDMAKDQEDIIFSGIKMNHKTYMGHYGSKGGAPVILYHALTGIKFAIANDADELADIQIHKISFKGLKNTGSFTFNAVTPSRDAFTWTSSAADPVDNVIYQTFEDGDLVTYKKEGDTNHFADSYFAAGANQNLNKADASYTFWLVPQVIDNSTAVMTIEYTMYGSDATMEIVLKDLKNSNWQAGQLRTYTFKLNEVNLKIEDKVTLAGSAANGFTDSKKDNVTITNTGNTRAFIRASLVGQWLRDIYAIDPDTGEETEQLIESYPVFGFTDNVNNLYEVASWYQDQFVKLEGDDGPKREHGHFVELSGYDKANGYNDWVLCKDGYYYYTVAVEPESKDVNGNSKTKALFKEYVVGIAPMSQIAGLQINNKNMHFTLEIATQAVAANKLDGTADTWLNAWGKAGVTPVPVQ